MTPLLFMLRLAVVGMAATVFGMSAVAIYYYIRLYFGRIDQPVRVPVMESHALMVALAYTGSITSGVINVIYDIEQKAPFNWYSSPVLGASMAIGIIGLYRLIRYESSISTAFFRVGPAGPAGPTGPQGEQGEKGDRGETTIVVVGEKK